MSYKVSAATMPKITLNETDPVKSVLQNVAIILSTGQNSVPLYREFGLPQQFIDRPMPVAKSMLYAEVIEAIEEFEPRAQIVDITFQADRSIPGRLIPTVEVEIIHE